MDRRVGLVVLAAAAAFGCTSDVDAPEAAGSGGGPAGERPALEGECEPELGAALAAWGEAGFSGTVTVAEGERFECAAGFGSADAAAGTPNTPDTVFSIGSISKAFTAAAVLDLADEGWLALDARAGDLVAGLGGPAGEATVEQLLLHTSGLTGAHGHDHQPLDREAAIAALSRLEAAFAPGSDFLYSNAGYTLLALVVEEVSGTSYRDHLAAEILPLPGGATAGGFWDGEPAAPGPRALGYLDDEGTVGERGDFAGPHWALDGNGGLAMTTRDLASWTRALFQGEVVSPEAVDVLTGTRFERGDGVAEVPGWVAGDASLYGEPAFLAAGGGGDVGHDAVVAWLPESERVIAMASNTPGVSAEELLQAIGPALVAGDPLPVPAGEGHGIDPAEAAGMVGTYRLDSGGSFGVTTRGDRLAVSAHGPDAVAALFPLPEGYTAAEARAHEEQVLALLAGETSEGREERATLESDLGPIGDVEVEGTIVDGGELRTYVTVEAGGEPRLVWYALDEEGGIAAAEITDERPTVLLVPGDGGSLRPDDPTGRGPELTVAFDDGVLHITGPGGTVAARAPSAG